MVEDEADGQLFVDFGRGAIIVDYDEVRFIIPSPEEVREWAQLWSEDRG